MSDHEALRTLRDAAAELVEHIELPWNCEVCGADGDVEGWHHEGTVCAKLAAAVQEADLVLLGDCFTCEEPLRNFEKYVESPDGDTRYCDPCFELLFRKGLAPKVVEQMIESAAGGGDGS